MRDEVTVIFTIFFTIPKGSIKLKQLILHQVMDLIDDNSIGGSEKTTFISLFLWPKGSEKQPKSLDGKGVQTKQSYRVLNKHDPFCAVSRSQLSRWIATLFYSAALWDGYCEILAGE